jgi:hypothetical protein
MAEEGKSVIAAILLPAKTSKITGVSLDKD